MKPLKSNLKGIQKTAKDYKSFAGVVNYLSMYCPTLQNLLKPICDLTRKGRPYICVIAV